MSITILLSAERSPTDAKHTSLSVSLSSYATAPGQPHLWLSIQTPSVALKPDLPAPVQWLSNLTVPLRLVHEWRPPLKVAILTTQNIHRTAHWMQSVLNFVTWTFFQLMKGNCSPSERMYLLISFN